MKQVKILKRPSATPPPASPPDRVFAEITALLDNALTRERARLDTIYQARQDALLSAVSAVLTDTLERLIAASAKREAVSFATSFAKLVVEQPPTPASSAAPDARASAPDPDPAALAETRAAFATAFEAKALPAFERAVADMMGGLAAAVEAQLEERVVAPAGGVVVALEGAADVMRAAKGTAADLAAAAVEVRVPDAEAEELAAVQAALDAGDVRAALRLCVGKSPAVQAKAISGALDTEEVPEKVFEEGVPSKSTLVGLAVLLAMDLGDRTEARLTWLYEVVTSMDDAEEAEGGERDVVDVSRRRLASTIENLSEFQSNGKLAPAQAKHVKLLIRVLKAHLQSM